MHSHCNSSSSDSGFSFLIFLSKCIAFQLHSIPMAMHFNCIAISIAWPFQMHCHFNCIVISIAFQRQCHSNGNAIPMAIHSNWISIAFQWQCQCISMCWSPVLVLISRICHVEPQGSNQSGSGEEREGGGGLFSN